MTDVEKRRADRLRVMKAIFDASEGSEAVPVSGAELLANLGLSDQELGDACSYLQGEHLIKSRQTMWGHLTPHMMHITHWGIKEMEQSLQAPGQPTQHFPPAVSIIHVAGNMIGSAIQSGSPGAQQEIVIGDLDLGSISEFVRELEKRVPDIDLAPEEGQELAAELATIRAQVESPKPKKQIIRESIQSIRSILEGAGGGVVAAELLGLLQHIHF